MPPEVAKNLRANETADVYSFAMVVWEMIALDKPFLFYDPQGIWDQSVYLIFVFRVWVLSLSISISAKSHDHAHTVRVWVCPRHLLRNYLIIVQNSWPTYIGSMRSARQNSFSGHTPTMSTVLWSRIHNCSEWRSRNPINHLILVWRCLVT